MGQKVSVSDDEDNELFNLFKLRQHHHHQQQQELSDKGILVLMRLITPTALTSKDRLSEANSKLQRKSSKQMKDIGQHKRKLIY
ncbi:unnamed protein product [Adineta ricciae]|uniref:Uncharacterized protein n=1 Tax=Adineta ricciae TaxID=249248 RepID=A0A813TKL3_ADIRI|nr:unnamed protein product [Adineta ricciae]